MRLATENGIGRNGALITVCGDSAKKSESANALENALRKKLDQLGIYLRIVSKKACLPVAIAFSAVSQMLMLIMRTTIGHWKSSGHAMLIMPQSILAGSRFFPSTSRCCNHAGNGGVDMSDSPAAPQSPTINIGIGPVPKEWKSPAPVGTALSRRVVGEEAIRTAIISSAMERGWSHSGSWAVAEGALKNLRLAGEPNALTEEKP